MLAPQVAEPDLVSVMVRERDIGEGVGVAHTSGREAYLETLDRAG
jgi:hypothetical protein